MPSPPLLLVMTTCATQTQASKIASILVEEALAACVSIVPNVQSFYRWQGELQQENELILLIKCPPEHYSVLEQRLQMIHPYEVPEIIALPIDKVLPAYLAWATKNDAKIPPQITT